jgi:hypothetical protein
MIITLQHILLLADLLKMLFYYQPRGFEDGLQLPKLNSNNLAELSQENLALIIFQWRNRRTLSSENRSGTPFRYQSLMKLILARLESSRSGPPATLGSL